MAHLDKPLLAAVNGDAHAGGFSVVIGCDLAIAADDATLGLPEAAAGLFPFIALAIVKDALPKKVLFDLIYRARLMSAAEARSLHVINEAVPRTAGARSGRRACDASVRARRRRSSRSAAISTIGHGGCSPDDALVEAERALLAALDSVDPEGQQHVAGYPAVARIAGIDEHHPVGDHGPRAVDRALRARARR